MKCLIVDDEPIARLGMKRLVGRHSDIEIVGMASSAEEALSLLDNTTVDLIFLDIRMTGLTGIEMARRLPAATMVIFTTAYSEYALDGYDVDAVDYLVKPIDPTRFDLAVDKARNYHRLIAAAVSSPEEPAGHPSVSAEYITVKADRRYVRLRFDDILFVEGLKDYVIIHTPERRVVTRMTLKSLEEIIPSAMFLRVNKSYIVNLNHIDSFDTNDIYISTHQIPIGQSYRDSTLHHLL